MRLDSKKKKNHIHCKAFNLEFTVKFLKYAIFLTVGNVLISIKILIILSSE